MDGPPDRDDHNQRGRNWPWSPQPLDDQVEDHHSQGLDHGRDHHRNEPPGPVDDGHRPDADQPEPQREPTGSTSSDHDLEPQRPRAGTENYSADDETPSPAPFVSHDSPARVEEVQPIESQPQPEASELGWGDVAWAEAGGFAAVMGAPSGGPAEAPTVVIDDLVINLTMLNQNTLIQNTQIVLDASDGGSITLGGDVTAISTQQALIDHSGWDDAWADAFASVLAGTGLPSGLTIDDLVFNTQTLNQNTLINNTEILFDAANAGVIAVGGNVSGIVSQEALIDSSAG